MNKNAHELSKWWEKSYFMELPFQYRFDIKQCSGGKQQMNRGGPTRPNSRPEKWPSLHSQASDHGAEALLRSPPGRREIQLHGMGVTFVSIRLFRNVLMSVMRTEMQLSASRTYCQSSGCWSRKKQLMEEGREYWQQRRWHSERMAAMRRCQDRPQVPPSRSSVTSGLQDRKRRQVYATGEMLGLS
ncbi:uncharacterized protein LOC106944095 [Poecilia latipinna]|uniref:uncharacterized protein LOC106944095 n=1 Tax=Poecilia latipinna TaxID=48699 RepID=UPI00072E8B5A|nr:PREDICTED: uncharacterized protein LOC106944095 [Poecilia latipinna]